MKMSFETIKEEIQKNDERTVSFSADNLKLYVPLKKDDGFIDLIVVDENTETELLNGKSVTCQQLDLKNLPIPEATFHRAVNEGAYIAGIDGITFLLSQTGLTSLFHLNKSQCDTLVTGGLAGALAVFRNLKRNGIMTIVYRTDDSGVATIIYFGSKNYKHIKDEVMIEVLEKLNFPIQPEKVEIDDRRSTLTCGFGDIKSKLGLTYDENRFTPKLIVRNSACGDCAFQLQEAWMIREAEFYGKTYSLVHSKGNSVETLLETTNATLAKNLVAVPDRVETLLELYITREYNEHEENVNNVTRALDFVLEGAWKKNKALSKLQREKVKTLVLDSIDADNYVSVGEIVEKVIQTAGSLETPNKDVIEARKVSNHNSLFLDWNKFCATC